jgi:hypothetical protein
MVVIVIEFRTGEHPVTASRIHNVRPSAACCNTPPHGTRGGLERFSAVGEVFRGLWSLGEDFGQGNATGVLSHPGPESSPK